MYVLLVIAVFGLMISICVHGVLSEVKFQKTRKAFNFQPFWAM